MRLSELRDFNPRFCFVDTETTSIDTKRAAPIEISIIKDDFSGDWSSEQWFLRPHINADIVDEALNVNKVTREELETLPEPHLVFKEFKKCLTEDVNPFKVGKGLKDKFFFVAYNAPFDSDIIRNFMVRNGDKYYGSLFFNPPVCIMQMAMIRLWPERAKLVNFKLATVARHLGIDFDEDSLHNALADVMLARKVFYELCE